MKKALVLLEQFLEKNTYVAGGHLTLADFSIVATVSSIEKVLNYLLFLNIIKKHKMSENISPFTFRCAFQCVQSESD